MSHLKQASPKQVGYNNAWLSAEGQHHMMPPATTSMPEQSLHLTVAYRPLLLHFRAGLTCGPNLLNPMPTAHTFVIQISFVLDRRLHMHPLVL